MTVSTPAPPAPTRSQAAAREHVLELGRPAPGAPDGRLRWRGTLVMGVLNTTPDSFSDGGAFLRPDAAIARGRSMVAAGARIVDVGGESTRPGAAPVPDDEELQRVVPVVAALADDGDALISIDTRKPAVAAAALDAGAHLVNDVTGLRNPEMRELCGGRRVAAVAMHMQGEPQTMQADPRYDDVVAEVERFLLAARAAALEAGVPGVVIDPGIGFGKTVEQNLALLAATRRLAGHGAPVLIGASRKSLIARLADAPQPGDRLPGTLALHLEAARRGAAIVRAHDVAAHVQAFAVQTALLSSREGAAPDPEGARS